ncbi:MAG: hypothetical protein F6J95_013950 [Leptolyngbya sp. SIO1E4]|nr:hypothetical protein [Leptolyngbya sp. SIO1E4]
MQTSFFQRQSVKPTRSQSLYEKSLEYFLGLWDGETGGFRFTTAQPATLMATSYVVLGLELLGGLNHLNSAQKAAAIDYLMGNAKADGSFADPLFDINDSLSEKHSLAYFQEETTSICQQALDALSAPPPPPRDWESDPRIKDGITHYFDSLAWQDPWMDSNPVMFLLSQLCHDAERHNRPELLQHVDTALDWLDAHQSPATGLWKGPYEVSLVNAMAATFHFTFFYFYRGRPLQHLERIIDSCLSLQQSHGLFSEGNVIGQTCLDYDAIDLLAKASAMTDYRAKDVQQSMKSAYQALLGLYSAEDGGFADSKEKLQPRGGKKFKILKTLGLSKMISPAVRVPTAGTYHVCWKLLSCERSHSNAFSTWFRLLGILLTVREDNKCNLKEEFTFRRLPFLGFHQ